MKIITIRVNDYTYGLIKNMKKHLGYASINKLVIELIEKGYIEKEKEYNGKN